MTRKIATQSRMNPKTSTDHTADQRVWKTLDNMAVRATALGLGLVVGLGLRVVLHELGHAIARRFLGVRSDIWIPPPDVGSGPYWHHQWGPWVSTHVGWVLWRRGHTGPWPPSVDQGSQPMSRRRLSLVAAAGIGWMMGLAGLAVVVGLLDHSMAAITDGAAAVWLWDAGENLVPRAVSNPGREWTLTAILGSDGHALATLQQWPRQGLVWLGFFIAYGLAGWVLAVGAGH